jgi:hypothetical protein
MGRFTARNAKAKLSPGVHADGEGLCLAVSATDARSWLFRSTKIMSEMAFKALYGRMKVEGITTHLFDDVDR